MGYYTTYSLSVLENDTGVDYEKEIGDIIDYQPFEESCKWYSHEKDMRKYSKKHPFTLFELTGEGEESGDLWREYYLNGQMQRVKVEILYPPFDKTKLQ